MGHTWHRFLCKSMFVFSVWVSFFKLFSKLAFQFLLWASWQSCLVSNPTGLSWSITSPWGQPAPDRPRLQNRWGAFPIPKMTWQLYELMQVEWPIGYRKCHCGILKKRNECVALDGPRFWRSVSPSVRIPAKRNQKGRSRTVNRRELENKTLFSGIKPPGYTELKHEDSHSLCPYLTQ